MKKIIAMMMMMAVVFSLTAQDEKTANDFKNEGNEAYKTKNYTVAFTAFSKAIELNKKAGTVDTALFYNAGYCAYKSKKYEAATDLFQKAIDLEYRVEKAYLFKVNSYRKARMNDEYIASLNEAYELYPKNKKLIKMMSGYQFKEGLIHYNKASQLIQQAAAMTETDQKMFAELKSKAEAEYQAALPYLEKAFKLSPKTRNLPEALKGVYEGLGMKDKAEEIGKFIEANAK